MKKRTQCNLLEAEVFDILSATWVFACNDENSIITYEGIRRRLNLNQSYDIREIIRSRGDLFRRGVGSRRLEAWKQDMRMGKRLPSWIREITEETQRNKTIDDITTDDVFRSQFRAEDSAPKASLQVIDWGLQHIDRLRRANHEDREQSVKSWQIWGMIIIGLLNIAVTIYYRSGTQEVLTKSTRPACSATPAPLP